MNLVRAVLGWVLLTACGARSEVVRPSAPEAIPLAVPQTYSAPADASSGSAGIADVCKIDPAACPTLDVEKGLQSGRSGSPEILLTGPLAGAPTVSARRGFASAAPSRPSSPAPPGPIPVKPSRTARAELFDIEARVLLQVEDIEKSRTTVTALTREAGGQIMNEVVEDSPSQRGASLSLRVPSERVHAFLEKLRGVGKLLSSKLETREVSRKIADASVLLRNLEQSLGRYEEMLKSASNVTDANVIEGELSRVRTEIDRVRSDLDWAKDRVARSTVYVTLTLEPDHEPLVTKAKLHPGVRAALLVDVPPADSTVPATVFAGGGISIQWPRSFSIDLDLLTSLRERTGGAVDFWIVTLGTELYSDLLGGGRRRFLNPYLGFRTGFARAPHQSFLPLGGSVGVDLYKTDAVLFAVETRVFALLARQEGPDFAVEPALGLNVAY